MTFSSHTPCFDQRQISTVIPTRNRPDQAAACVRSVLQNEYPDVRVLVIDQSTNDQTRTALQPFLADSRVSLIQTATQGSARARNLGVTHADTEVVVFIDDDCEAFPDWLREFAAGFAVHPQVGIIFGAVLPGPYAPQAGFIPVYHCRTPVLAKSIKHKHLVEGITACMGIRRCVLNKLGGFDERLGAGGCFFAAEETDLTIRALLARIPVYETPRIRVLHHGFRPWTEANRLIHGYLFGIGAMFGKHCRCGNWTVGVVMLQLLRRWAFGKPVVEFGHFPSRWLRLNAFLKGFAAGATQPVNRSSSLFAEVP